MATHPRPAGRRLLLRAFAGWPASPVGNPFKGPDAVAHFAHWLTGLDAALLALPDDSKRKIIRTVVEAGEKGLTRDELAAALGIHPNGGSYGQNLGWLRTMGLLPERGTIKATDGLMR